MSIYEGTIGEREYAHGRDEGRAAADWLAENGSPASWYEEDAKENAQSESYRTRAYYLGWLRGYREVIR